MSKFCENCGAKMEDADKVCGQCGTPVGSSADPVEDYHYNAVLEKTKKIVKYVFYTLIAIVVIVGLNITSKYVGYKGTLNKFAKCIGKDDAAGLEKIESALTELAVEEYYTSYDSAYDLCKDYLDDTLDEIEEKIPDYNHITYEVTSVRDLSDREINEIKDYLIDYFNADVSHIKRVKTVDINLIVKGKNRSGCFPIKGLGLVKERGKWRVITWYRF